MKKKLILFFIPLIFIFGCSSDFSEFREQAFVFASDNKIDQDEYNTLVGLIQSSSETTFNLYKNNSKIDNSKVVSELLKYFTAKKLNLSASDIWQPITNTVKDEKFTINVFLENSGSMNGYLDDPNTQFKNSVYSLLARLKLFNNSLGLNLALINKGDQLLFTNASNNDIVKFKEILNPSSFRQISAGKTGESDLNDLINRSLIKSNKNNLSVFISDCIYSPGKNIPDAKQYLVDQKEGIFLNFATELKKRDLNLIILQLFANFKGKYYDHLNNEIKIVNSISRPYYIWFIGTENQINQLIRSKKLEEIEGGGYKNKLVIQPIKNVEQPKHKIISKPTAGNFDKTDLGKFIITKASASKEDRNKGEFGFNVAVDFSQSLQDGEYFLDPTNYKLNNKDYSFIVDEIQDKTNPSTIGFTHILKLKTSKLKEETLIIDIIGKVPSWVYNSTSNNDANILSDDSEKQKTFGFKYLAEGVCNAFYPKSKSNTVSSISITIKK